MKKKLNYREIAQVGREKKQSVLPLEVLPACVVGRIMVLLGKWRMPEKGKKVRRRKK